MRFFIGTYLLQAKVFQASPGRLVRFVSIIAVYEIETVVFSRLDAQMSIPGADSIQHPVSQLTSVTHALRYGRTTAGSA
ncbi:MAG TPA: hypothetical protein VFT99_02645, partial [Roseiflexaceae bacterium]|nr:hypothetical protein [Roseiflexaceae bacterium]